MHVAKFGNQALLVVAFSDEGDGRDWVTQSPARGDRHLLQERGLRQSRTSVEIVFCDEPGKGDYMDRWLAFRALASAPAPALFTHPIHGAYEAVVDDLRSAVSLPERAVRATCTFVGSEQPQAVFEIGAGVTPAAGPEQVTVLADQSNAALAAQALTSSTPQSCVATVTAWAEATDPDARAIAMEAASLAAEIDEGVAALGLATDLTRWEAYRAMINLRYAVVRAAAATTSETSQVVRYTLQAAEPLRSLCARLFGARAAEERARQVAKLNGLRTPGLVPAGTELKLPALGAR